MKNAAQTTYIKKPDSAILIVDRIGVIGERLSQEFSRDFYVVLISKRIPKKINKKTSFIKLKGKIPKVPKNKYSKIFLIDDGASITKESSFSYINEARRLNADFYFLGSVRNFDIKHTDELTKLYSKSKVLVFGDLFDKEYLFDHDASITKFIIEASNKGKIKVPGDGLSLSYPITFEDTIKLVISASYLKISQKIILLFYIDPITDLSLAHLFQKIDPDIKVDFIKEYRNQDIFIPDGAEFAISKYNIKQKIKEIDLSETKEVILAKKNKGFKKISFLKSTFFLFLVIFFLIFLPFLTMQTYGYFAKSQLNDSILLIKENRLNEALEKAERAETFFIISKNTSNIASRQLFLVGRENSVENFITQVSAGEEASKSLQEFIEGVVLLESVFKNETIRGKEDFIKGLDKVKNSYSDIQKINIVNTDNDLGYTRAEEVYELSNAFLGVSEVLPDVLGFEGEKTYLVLFQDSNELRSGGGKITTVGEITLKDANITKFELLDVKELDEKLDVHVEPPFPIRRYLPSVDFYLKDSNFDPDFVNSSITASAIYNLEEEAELDGVIGLDLYFIKSLLDEIGPIYIEEVDKNITDENLFQVSSEYEEKSNEDYFTTKLLEKAFLLIDQGEELKFFQVLNVFGKSMRDKHMLFAFKDPYIQSLFIANNYSSSLTDNRSISDTKINDFIGISESNLGDNKINNFISRSISKKNIITSNGNFTSEVTIAFKNSSQRGSSFAKTYKNYIQVILPEDVKLNNISVNGNDQDVIPAISDFTIYEDSRFEDPEELEVDQVSVSGKSIFSFLVNISPDSITTIKINYDTPFKVISKSNSSSDYSLLIYKQPGVSSIPFNLTFEQDGSYIILPDDSMSLDIVRDEIIESTISKK